MERLLELTIKNKMGHFSSTITTLPILEEIFKNKHDNDEIVLSNGHAGLALYVLLEKYYNHDAQKMLDDFGIHPHRDLERNIPVSTGSLGCGLPIAVGIALGNPNKVVHCVISDGESFEGSIWESLMFIYNNNITNINVYVNMNGFSAYDVVNEQYLINRLKSFLPSIIIYKTCTPSIEKLKGIHGHYIVLEEVDKEDVIKKINEETICKLVA